MKKSIVIICVLFVFACADLFNTEQYKITYTFVNIDEISEPDITRTIEVIKTRLEKYLKNVEVRSNSKKEIIVKLNKGFILESVNQVVENQGKLDFWPCIKKDKMMKLIIKIDNATANNSMIKSFSSMIQSISPTGFPIFLEEDLSRLKKLLKEGIVQSILTDDYKDVKLIFGLPYNDYVELYGIESNKTNRALVNETHIVDATQDYDQINRPAVSIKMNDLGADIWYQMTNNAFENNTKIAVTLNDIVYSAPGVTSGPISGGFSQISGSFTLNQAVDLANVLSSKKMIPQLRFKNVIKLTGTISELEP